MSIETDSESGTARSETDGQRDGVPEDAEVATESAVDAIEGESAVRSPIGWKKFFVFVVIPLAAMLLGGTAGVLKWHEESVGSADVAGVEAVQAAKDSTIALLSYEPKTVDTKLLAAAHDLLTGEFQGAYSSLVTNVVIPGAKEKQIAAEAAIPAAALVSANAREAVVLVFVNQTVVLGSEAPATTASTVRVTMNDVNGRWLISKFEPV